jgi:glycosyltransferase involved in cell wall biosynthesis
MRIGIITGEYPPLQGGVGAYSEIIARTLHEMGHEVAVFCPSGSLDTGLSLAFAPPRWNLRALIAIRRWAQQERLDVLNLQFQTAAYQMSPWIHFLPQVAPVPLVTLFHDLRFPYLFPKAGKLRDWIVMHLARTSAGCIVTNHEDYERVHHLPHSTLIPIGSNIRNVLLSVEERTHWRRKSDASASDILLTYFGFMNHSKGVTVLLDSLAELRQQGFTAKLVLIGGRTGTADPTNAAYADSIEQQIEQLGLREQVTWTGYVTEHEVSAYLHAGDLCVLPFLDGASYRRGSLMAAIGHGCAIVTTTPQVPIPTFEHGRNLHLVSIGDAAALAQAIRHLSANPALRATLQQGAQQLSAEFDWRRIAQATLTVFERVVTEQTV